MKLETKTVAVIGGGLAGLTTALALARAGVEVTLIERKSYPFHKVCGEYVSNEVIPYLTSLGAEIDALAPGNLNRFMLSAPSGKYAISSLSQGGFGISRYAFDNYLYQMAKAAGVNCITGTQVNEVHFEGDRHILQLSNGSSLEAHIAAGTFGKRSKLDRQLDRAFFKERSPYIGVKYHIKCDFDKNTIALLNFEDGYCGINKIEEDLYCVCYLASRDLLKKHGTIEEMERQILWQNPILKDLFTNSEMLYDKPEVINEISFATKETVSDHILMAGDAAGMITPVCGNGMAMAIHGGKIMKEEILQYLREHNNRDRLEEQYTHRWHKHFGKRMWMGRTLQMFFGKNTISEMAVGISRTLPPVFRWAIRQTYGEPF